MSNNPHDSRCRFKTSTDETNDEIDDQLSVCNENVSVTTFDSDEVVPSVVVEDSDDDYASSENFLMNSHGQCVPSSSVSAQPNYGSVSFKKSRDITIGTNVFYQKPVRQYFRNDVNELIPVEEANDILNFITSTDGKYLFFHYIMKYILGTYILFGFRDCRRLRAQFILFIGV